MTNTIDRAAITGLLERVKGATGPDRELGAEVFCAVSSGTRLARGHLNAQMICRPDGSFYNASEVPDYTASIDAALALVERVLPGCVWSIEADHCWIRIATADDVEEFQSGLSAGGGRLTAIAIIASLLTALEQS